MKIVFFGTPLFAASILEYLIDNNINIVAVVTQSDKKRGKVSSVKEIAEKKLPNIKIYQPEKATGSDFINEMKTFKPDLFVVVAYGKILRQKLLDVPLKGAINVHASILPKYRGAAPIQRAIINGEKKTGVTVMQMSAGLDSGDIIATKEIPIDDKINFGQLHDILCDLAKPLLLDVIKNWEKNYIKKYTQDESLATYAPKITSEDLEIDFSKEAYSIHNQIRGLSPFPGACSTFEINNLKKRVKILESAVVSFIGKPKEILKFEKNDFIIACGKDAILVKKLQVEGKKIVSATDFIRGIKGFIKII